MSEKVPQSLAVQFGAGDSLAPSPSSAVAVESNKLAAEIQAALIIAKQFPRNELSSVTRIKQSCERFSFAEVAMYQYPRGGAQVRGPSIRMAEVLAQAWGNMRAGVNEVERKKDVSIAKAWAWDLETNTAFEMTFEVPHEIMLSNKTLKRATDPRDIYELVSNMGSRRMRACILRIIPQDVQELAIKTVEATIKRGDGTQTTLDRVRSMVLAFSEVGVPQDAIEQRLGHALDSTSPEELVELTGIYRAIRDKVSSRTDFFNLKATHGEKADKILDTLK